MTFYSSRIVKGENLKMTAAQSAFYSAANHSTCNLILLITRSHIPESVKVAVSVHYRVTVCDGCPLAKAFKVY